MQPGSAGTIQAQTTEQDHAGDGIGRLGQASPRQIVMHEALGDEAAEQPLHDAMFQVQMDDVVVERAGIFEDDGTNRRFATPLPELLIAFARRPQRVHRIDPRRIGP